MFQKVCKHQVTIGCDPCRETDTEKKKNHDTGKHQRFCWKNICILKYFDPDLFLLDNENTKNIIGVTQPAFRLQTNHW